AGVSSSRARGPSGTLTAARGCSRKLPAWSCFLRRASTRCRSAALSPQALSRKAGRSAGGSSWAASNSSRSVMGGLSGRPHLVRNRREKCARIFSSVPLQLLEEPGPGVGPEPVGAAQGQAEQVRGVVHGLAGEVAQLDELRRLGFDGGQARQGL